MLSRLQRFDGFALLYAHDQTAYAEQGLNAFIQHIKWPGKQMQDNGQ
ncbi:hypothetical protein QWU01_12865 [Kluyvera cryocrescens]|uniref:Uncharacterized protein n=1 Tax=Kluyvera cryocrescens TaxID=580 RepID=A0AAW9C5W6_KLUCR|nr:hypothetical protein [Kluyvera cryocrescens]